MTGDLLDSEVRYLDEDEVLVSTTAREVDEDRLSRSRPIRSIPAYAGMRHYDGLYWSSTTRSHVPYESLMERDRLLWADFDPAVLWISAQPMALTIPTDRRPLKRIPDFLLQRPGGSLLVVDVKSPEALRDPDVDWALASTGRFCASRGWAYEVWTGVSKPRMANVRRLARTRRGHVDPHLVDALRKLEPCDWPIWGIVDSLDAGACRVRARTAVEWLLWCGAWRTDLARPLSDNHLVSVTP